MTVFNQLGVAVTHFNMEMEGFSSDEPGASGRFKCHIPKLPFPPGKYRIAAAMHVVGDHKPADLIPNICTFEVTSSTFYRTGKTPRLAYCSCLVPHEWKHICSGAREEGPSQD
jgi:hypothetical protein